MSISDFTILKKLGSGSFSEVFHVKRLSDQSEYAMKKVKLQKLSQKEQQNALNEIRILASVTHKNIIGYKEAFFDESTNQLCIVMEIADGGDLDAKITQAKNIKSFVKEEKIWHIFKQLVDGLVALHKNKIVHRDIKCANVFLSNDGGVKLGDLNVSKVAKYGIMQTQTGTPYYCPPEVWKDQPYNSKCDIWSLGCVIYELTALKPPFLAKNMKELYTKVTRGHYPDIPRHFSRELSKMIGLCLNTNPLLRPSAEDLQSMPSMSGEKEGDSTSRPEGRKHRRSNSQTEKKNDTNKIELLKTIKLPRNLKQLNKGLLPEKQYTEEEEQIPSKQTSVSYQVAKDKNSLQECKDQSQLNYDTDAGVRQAAGSQEANSHRRAIEARARRYRNRANNVQSQQKVNEDNFESLEDSEPTKPSIEAAKKHRQRNNHSIQSHQERPGNLLPQLTPHYQDASNRKAPPSNKPPNIPQTPVKPTRPRPHNPQHLEEGKETDATIESHKYGQQVPTSVGYNHQRFNYGVVGMAGGSNRPQGNYSRLKQRASSQHDVDAGGYSNQIKSRIAENSPVNIRDAAQRESGLYHKRNSGGGLHVDPSYPSLNQIIADGAASRHNQQYSQKNLHNNNQSRLGQRYNSNQPTNHCNNIQSQDNLLSNHQFNSRNQQQDFTNIDKYLPNFQSEQKPGGKALVMKYDEVVNGLRRAKEIVGNQTPLLSNNVKPPMSSRPGARKDRDKMNGVQKSNRPPTGRQIQLQPSSSNAVVGLDQGIYSSHQQKRSPRGYYGNIETNQDVLNNIEQYGNQPYSQYRTPQMASSSGKKPVWWG